MDNILYLVIPCYNEEEALPYTVEVLKPKIEGLIKAKKISEKSKILFVDDGSKDKTYELIKSFSQKENLICGVKLSRNCGHQNALLAGLNVAKEYADLIISMDADLQDDINAIDEMIEKYLAGNEIVYGVRNSRKKDTLFKKITAQTFYKLMKKLGVEIIYNHSDYRLMSKRAVEELMNYKETNMFLRGIVPQIGLKNDIVYYERNERVAGKTKYPLKKMIKFATNAITSFSVKPLKWILNIGTIIILISILSMVLMLINKVEKTSILICSLWLLGGIQLLSLGVVGEYIGKIYDETKARPKYIIEETVF